MQHILRAGLFGSLVLSTLAISGCDSILGPDDDPASIEITASRTELDLLGDTLMLSAVVETEGGDVLSEATTNWISRRPSVVRVDADGVATAVSNGSAWVVARSGGAADSVRLTVNSPIPCAPSGDLAIAATVPSSITNSDCRNGQGKFYDIWRFPVEQGTQLTVEMVSDELDAYLWLMDERGSVIAQDDDGGTGTNARITRSLPSGQYFVVTTTYGPGSTGAYQVRAIEGVPPSPCPATATVGFPDTVTGTTGADGCVFQEFYLDVWRLELPVDTTVVLRVDSDDLEPAVVVADTLGQFLTGTSEGPGNSAVLELTLEAGSYDLWVGDASEPERSGSYTLSVRPGPTLTLCPAEGGFPFPGTVTGEITAQDCYLSFSSGDVWDLELSDTTDVRVAASGSGFRPVIFIVNAAGEVIEGFGGESSSLDVEVRLAGGTYRVWMLTNENGTGSYSLSLTGADQLPDCEPDGALAVGDSVSGALSTTDCQLPGGQYVDVWTTRLDTTGTVTVTLESDKVDAFLMVADSSGTRISRDDDSGDGLNAALTLELEAGLYQIWATSAGADEVGGYTLGLAQSSGGSRARVGASSTKTPSAADWFGKTPKTSAAGEGGASR